MARRLDKTLIDYLVIAVSPALIMTLVGSLVFFLIEVFYQGRYEVRVQYILALFVFAAVLIARIAIEEGKERARLFAIPLAIATLLAVGRFTEFQGGPLVVILIGVIWWCTEKLTWDCTFVDERERDSGEGLLEAVGLDKPVMAAPDVTTAEKEKEIEGVTSRDAPAMSWRERLAQRRRRPHPHGIWVVYFSLAALPLFGIGQLLIPASSLADRQYAFHLLVVYVASGLGLLLTTSFLGLRRYLRQRRVEMPSTMANMWLTIGCVLIVVLLAFAALLPRPSPEYSTSQLALRIGSPEQKSSRFAMGDTGAEEDRGGPHLGEGDDGRHGSHSTDEDEDEGGAGSEEEGAQGASSSGTEGEQRGSSSAGKEDEGGERSADERDDGGSSSEAREEGDGSSSPNKESADKEEDETEPPDSRATQQGGRAGNIDQRPPPGALEPIGSAGGWLLGLLKWVFYAALILLAIYWLRRSRAELLAMLRSFLQGWREFWQKLFGLISGAHHREKAGQTAAVEDGPKQPSQRPFATFADPFTTGIAGRYSPDELVQYSFEALEAWARGHACARTPDQTPHEFARNISARVTRLARDTRMLADLYCQVAYAPGTLPAESTDRLKPLWRQLRSSPTAVGTDAD